MMTLYPQVTTFTHRTLIGLYKPACSHSIVKGIPSSLFVWVLFNTFSNDFFAPLGVFLVILPASVVVALSAHVHLGTPKLRLKA